MLRASHFGPTFAVTLVSFLLAVSLWWEGPAFIIAFGVFLGQLLVGWSNDLNDYQDDLKHNRVSKPLVSGQLSTKKLKLAIKIVAPMALVFNLFGPLGLKGGSLYLFGVGMGVAYNFYFKFNIFSPLPYAVAFAILPSCMAFSQDKTPPTWMWLGGALFGMAAHFLNVLKDMDQDHASGIKGLPQRCGKAGSIIAATILIAFGVTLLLLSDLTLR